MTQMTATVERLVRLMVLLPENDHPVWESLIADCGDAAEVMSMRWFVGDAAKMWPSAAPVNLAGAVLTVFAAAGEQTLRFLSDAVLGGSGRGPQAGAAWVAQASAGAIDVLAQDRPLGDVLQDVKERWSLRPSSPVVADHPEP
jgi:hypothetical protein